MLGSVVTRPDGRFEVRFRVYDIVKQAPLGAIAYVFTKENARAAAHRVADFVYEKITGEKGVFSTQIAYVVRRGAAFELQIADADGERAQYLLRSNEPIISPVWSPDGRRIAYVSFESKKPVVYVHHLEDRKRQVVASFRGSNSAPAWSPDGKTLAVVLSVRRRLADLPRSTPTAAARGGASATPTRSTPSRASRATESGSTSPPTAAAARRSTACPRAAASRSASPSRAAIMFRRAPAPTAGCSPT